MDKLNTETGEHSGASLCSEFIFLMGQIECMMERAAKYRDESAAEGDTETAGKNARVYCVLKEIHRLGNAFAANKPPINFPNVRDQVSTPASGATEHQPEHGAGVD
jgi:hypothetical protein